MFHTASFEKCGNTIHVADIWKSEEQMNNFVNSRLLPVMQTQNATSKSRDI
jgi:hypothetical protein